jgi:hypothetical protein
VRRRFAWLPAFVLALTAAVHAHVTLEPERAREMLAEVARYHDAGRAEPDQEARLDALFRTGEAVLRLVEALNQDALAHGEPSPLARELVGRLRTYSIHVTFSERTRQHAYDLAAFEEYLRRAPGGRRAPDARFRLLARAFYETLGADPATLLDTDPAAVLRAIKAEEQFLQDYPRHDKAGQVQFFLAVDYYRVSRNVPEAARARAYAERARQELARVVAGMPETFEARAAAVLIERLAASR